MEVNGSSIHTNDGSLGILNMDSLKVFGDLSHDSFKNTNMSASNGVDRRISDRLNMERKKALEALQKSGKSDIARKSAANKENLKSPINNASTNSSIPLDRTDYVPIRRPKPINISDLVTDETINLETTPARPSSAAKDKNPKISFEPSEITGRSTLYRKDMKMCNGANEKLSTGKTRTMSVNEILASSFAIKARNLCDTLNNGDSTLDLSTESGHLPGISSVSSSTGCSSFSNARDSRSLPRTADMSLSKASSTQLSFNGGGAVGTFSFSAGAGDESAFAGEDFAPGELMRSKLIMDEISWAKQYAAIPTVTLSEQAKSKAAVTNSNGFETPSASNSVIADDPNFSVGNFFRMRSENIWDIVKSESPTKCRTPFALVGEEDDSTTSAAVSTSSFLMKTPSTTVDTPVIDNKTYTRVSSQINSYQESKDSGNVSDNSYLLSVSAIDRALSNLERTSNVIPEKVLMMQTKNSKSCMNPTLFNTQAISDGAVYSRIKGASLGSDIKLAVSQGSLPSVSEIILENKENLDPQVVRGIGSKPDLSDTMSFTESLLNSSEMKQMQHSRTQPRSPLSPIDVGTVPNVQIIEASDGEEADNDEWPGTPKHNSNRRVRRTKSPHDKSPLCASAEAEDSSDATTPVNSRPTRSHVMDKKTKAAVGNNNKEPKSLCSTRLDGEQDDCDFGISPNLSASKTSALLGRSNTLTPGSANIDNSPLSTLSRSYNLPQASPSTPTKLDTTSNPERQLVSPAAAARKVVSSPAGSEASSTCSYATMHSTRSATSAGRLRTVSRCSSTSEFSHRDGKPIPLKVTAFELSWGSIKLRSDSRKSMQIKNIINKRLVIRVEVSGPGFQIVNNQRGNNISLHSQECRTINISFCPTVPGVAVGKLSFYAPTGASTIGHSLMDVALYGYGGSANVVPQKVTIGPVGSPFITMGDICDLSHPLSRSVRFYNKGPLLAFAVITVDSLGLMLPRISDAFEIQPQRVLIPPQSTIDVQISFKPKREEIRKILKKIDNVLALATMRIISGDEANRQRIRRLLGQMHERERSKMSSSTLDMLWTTFPGENEMSDLAAIRESPSVAMDLASSCRIHEIVLTINRENMDDTAETSSLFLPDAEETVLFRTVICAADSNSPTPPTSLDTVHEVYEEDNRECQASSVTTNRKDFWSIKPSIIEVNLKRPERVSLFVHNGFKSRQYFEVGCNKKQLLKFSPSEGYVAPDNGQTEIVIDVSADAANDIQEDVFVTVYMENERIMVPVKIVNSF